MFSYVHTQHSNNHTNVHTQHTNDYTLNILHLNDFHARFEQTNIYSGRCSDKDAQANKCYGGLARIHSKLKELRRERENVLFLAAGDYYQGTVWYTIHRWRAMAHFLNLIGQDAMSVGNHEFDDGVEGFAPFLDNVTFPVLASNIDDSLELSLRGKILPSVVLERGGRKIGIVGYVTTETAIIANPGKVKLLDEVESVRKESRRLRRNGVDIIIALGHAGFRKDLDIARNVEDVDVVVGGHTNTFLYTGADPSTEPSMGVYPTVVKQNSSSRVVLVVQAYAFGKYLGDLQVSFDHKGEITTWEGNPILLDNTVPQDKEILQELVPWRRGIDQVITEAIGRTYVFLDGNRMSCRMKECNLGNLETDAIVHQNAKYPDDMEWAQTALAVINGGGIRASIDEKASNGGISMEDILTVAPFQNTIDIVELKGRHVRQMFEHSVGNYDPAGLDPPGRFLQVSGFHVVYDITKPVGSRVVSLAARCSACRIPDFREVEDERIYKIAMPSFLANGGDGYAVVRDNKINHHLTGLLDTDIITQYIRLFSPIYQGIENRILFLHSAAPCSAFQDPPLLHSNSSTASTTSSPLQSSASLLSSPLLVSRPVTIQTGDSIRSEGSKPVSPNFTLQESHVSSKGSNKTDEVKIHSRGRKPVKPILPENVQLPFNGTRASDVSSGSSKGNKTIISNKSFKSVQSSSQSSKRQNEIGFTSSKDEKSLSILHQTTRPVNVGGQDYEDVYDAIFNEDDNVEQFNSSSIKKDSINNQLTGTSARRTNDNISLLNSFFGITVPKLKKQTTIEQNNNKNNNKFRINQRRISNDSFVTIKNGDAFKMLRIGESVLSNQRQQQSQVTPFLTLTEAPIRASQRISFNKPLFISPTNKRNKNKRKNNNKTMT